MYHQEGVLTLHRAHILGRHQVHESRECMAGGIHRQSVTRNQVHTQWNIQKAVAPERCHGVDESKIAQHNKEHLTKELLSKDVDTS